ncbi:hypothetical protein M758_4G061000 [Ceratodon purpureus]|nr:hypothetical protein M758_4G061000 [Ceratodon purpureus]
MAAVRGLCTSSLASTSYTSSSRACRLSSSSTRSNAHFSAKAVRHSSRKCRLVLLAVLVDPQVESKIATLKQETSDSEVVDSLLLKLADSTNFQTEVQGAVKVKSSSKVTKKEPVLGLTDTNLKSNLEHRLWVAFGATTVAGMVAKALSACQSGEDVMQVGAGLLASWVLSDLGTGFYHWGVDNYGDASTPFFGSQIDAFQGHHQRPWTITKREFANNIHAIARPAGMFLTPFLLLPSHPFGDSFLGFFLGMVIMSQQTHALSHFKKSQLPPFIIALQDNGVLLGRKMHGTHHKPPYDVNYCIVSGLWNPLLDRLQIFPRMERFIYNKWNVAPRSWSETSHEWMQADTYFEDGTEFDPYQSS